MSHKVVQARSRDLEELRPEYSATCSTHSKISGRHLEFNSEGREGVKWELGLALFWTGKMGFTHWDWDLATGNGTNNYKMGMGFFFLQRSLLQYFELEK